MRIGVVGAGHLGATLSRQLVMAGHEVAVSNSRGPESLRGLGDELGGHAHPMTAADAVRYGDVVLLAVPFNRVREVPTDGVDAKIVIDATNYLPERDGHDALLDSDTMTSSELVAAHLPTARLVKTFNAMRWDHLRDFGHTGGSAQRYGVPVSGDDDGAKRVVYDLIEQLGFEPVDAGDLVDGGRKHQPGSELYSADLPAEQLHAKLGTP